MGGTPDLDLLKSPGLDVPLPLCHASYVVVDEQSRARDSQNETVRDRLDARDKLLRRRLGKLVEVGVHRSNDDLVRVVGCVWLSHRRRGRGSRGRGRVGIGRLGEISF